MLANLTIFTQIASPKIGPNILGNLKIWAIFMQITSWVIRVEQKAIDSWFFLILSCPIRWFRQIRQQFWGLLAALYLFTCLISSTTSAKLRQNGHFRQIRQHFGGPSSRPVSTTFFTIALLFNYYQSRVGFLAKTTTFLVLFCVFLPAGDLVLITNR